MRPAEELARLWAAEELDMEAIGAVTISAWRTYQLVYFLDKILAESPLPPGKETRVTSPCAASVSGQRDAERTVTRAPATPGVRTAGGHSARRASGCHQGDVGHACAHRGGRALSLAFLRLAGLPSFVSALAAVTTC